MFRSMKFVCALALAFFSGAYATMATPVDLIEVGTGSSHAQVCIDFKDGASYTFDVAFDGVKYGLDLMDTIEASTTLTTVRIYDGLYIDGFSYDGHSDAGWNGGEDYWHYWVHEADTPWAYSQVGAFDRQVQDGSVDGYVYGRATAPAPEPATALLALLAAGMLCRRSRGR